MGLGQSAVGNAPRHGVAGAGDLTGARSYAEIWKVCILEADELKLVTRVEAYEVIGARQKVGG